MNIFLDTAHVLEIKKWAQTGILDGVTINPTHLAKEKTDPLEITKQVIALLPDGQISVQVTETEPEKIFAQAREIAKLGDNVLVKVPCHVNYYAVIKRLVAENIPLNITLVFSVMQGVCMAKLGVAYVSPFIGRLEDIDADGIELIADLREIFDAQDYQTGILAASLRTVEQLTQVILAGADAVTLPPELLEKATTHPLTDAGMKKFADDWSSLGVRQFP